MPNGLVLTWAAIASLWALFPGRRAPRAPHVRRQAQRFAELHLADDPEIPIGLNLLELSRRLYKLDLRVPETGELKWVDWAPMPEVAPANEDLRLGNTLFFGELGWIMRHEIAHVTLRHVVGVASIQAENQADRQATEWYRGQLVQADAGREPGARPARPEIELEFGPSPWASDSSGSRCSSRSLVGRARPIRRRPSASNLGDIRNAAGARRAPPAAPCRNRSQDGPHQSFHHEVREMTRNPARSRSSVGKDREGCGCGIRAA